MTLVGFVGVLLSLAALPFACAQRSRQRFILFFLLLLTHFASTLLYHQTALSTSADTALYYYYAQDLADQDFAFGTIFVGTLVDNLKNWFGGSYLDFFFLFQSLGFWGIIVLMRTFEEIHIELGAPERAISQLLLFMPGMHFWTSAIGKDAPLFLGISLAVWAAMRPTNRILPLIVGLLIIVLFRPHILMIAAVSIAIAHMLDRRASILTKVGLTTIAIAGFVVVAGTLKSAIGLSPETDLNDLGQRRELMAELTAGSTTIGSSPYPWRLFSQLFRPLFFDAPGVFGIIASFESLLFMFIVGFTLRNWREARRLASSVFFLRFSLVFAVVLALLLAVVFYNVGLGLRQKMMLVPPLFAFFVAHYSLHQLWRNQAALIRVSGRQAGAPS